MEYANRAAFAQLQSKTRVCGRNQKVTVRFRNLLEPHPLRLLGSKHISKLVMLEGIVVRASPARPMVMEGAFKCKWCGAMSVIPEWAVLDCAAGMQCPDVQTEKLV
jgi:DNA replicative helicase MCM subunit Mcm2 (Cdc46/Mcm family)